MIKLIPAREAKDASDRARKVHMVAQHELVYKRIADQAAAGFSYAIFDVSEVCFIVEKMREELKSLGYRWGEHALVSSMPVINPNAGRKFTVDWS